MSRARRPLSRDRVLSVAMELADLEGLSSLSMRRLGKELGVEAMSLYYHLPGKGGLLDGLTEALINEISDAVSARPSSLHREWKSDLRSRCLCARDVVLKHPWTPALFSARPTIPATLYVYVDGVVGLMVHAGFTFHVAHRALHALGSMLFGFTQELFSPPSSGGQLDVAQTQAEFAKLSEMLPNLGAMIASEIHAVGDPTIGWCDSQSEFEFTLDLILDGLERLR
jgi:AcrR family transcriptional regulator